MPKIIKEVKKPKPVFAVSSDGDDDDDDDDEINDIDLSARSSSPVVASNRPKRANRDTRAYKVISFLLFSAFIQIHLFLYKHSITVR